ncbi:MAG: gluconolactonase [Phenylobacterium sp.]|nr:gluconolactonase [Phenylobacterium sp.]
MTGRLTARTIAGLAILGAMLGVGAAQAAGSGYHVIDKIPGPDGGWDYVRIDTANNRALAPRGTAVMAIDLATKQVTGGLVPGARQHIALPLSGGREMLVTNGGTDSAIFADAAGHSIASVPTAKGPDSATFDPSSGLVLVMGHLGGEVTLIDPKTHQVAGTIPIGGILEEAAVDGAGRAFVAVEDKHEIVAVDIAGRKATAHWALPGCDGPTGLAYDPQDKLLIAACDGLTAIVSAVTGKVEQTLPTGKGADGAVYDAKRHLAFVPAGRDGTLAVIGFSRGQARIVELVPTEKGARTLGLDERTGRIYLPSAQYVLPAGGGRPTVVPGTFHMLVVGR